MTRLVENPHVSPSPTQASGDFVVVPPPRLHERPSQGPARQTPAPQQPASASADEPPEATFGVSFWCAYFANATIVTANGLMLRYVEFVKLYEPDNYRLWLGWIVGVGMVGSLLMRLVQGGAIDRYGVRLMWVLSSSLLVATCLAHLLLGDIHNPAVFLLRTAYSTCLAGAFGSSMVYVSRRATPDRMAEMIGTLGTSGFVGMVCGPILGDLLFKHSSSPQVAVERMFLLAAALGTATLVFCWLATRKVPRPVIRRKRPPILWLLRRYHPGPVIWMGIAMGVGIGVATTFMADFAREMHVANIWVYFTTFAVTAFVTRLSIRRFPAQHGIRAMLLVGGSAQVVSFLLLLPVTQEWHLILPALASGVAHAFLFPGVVAGGGTAFPERYRGIGTTLMLGTLDVGTLLGAPAAGAMLNLCRRAGLPAYPSTFLATALLLASVSTYFYLATAQLKKQAGSAKA